MKIETLLLMLYQHEDMSEVKLSKHVLIEVLRLCPPWYELEMVRRLNQRFGGTEGELVF